MTLHGRGYALRPGESLEDLDMGGGSILSMRVTPAGIDEFFRVQRDYLASLPPGAPPDPAAFGALPGAESRPTVRAPLSS